MKDKYLKLFLGLEVRFPRDAHVCALDGHSVLLHECAHNRAADHSLQSITLLSVLK